MSHELVIGLVLIPAIVLVLFWVDQLIDLMGRSDGQFPGRYDKICWFIILMTMNVLGAFIWFIFKNIRKTGKP